MSCNVQLASVPSTQSDHTFTPAAGVTHYVAVRAINTTGTGAYSTETSFSIPSLTQPLNQSNPVGVAIAGLNMSVIDPDGSSLTFTHTGLPPGLTINGSTGRITGTPSAAGTYNVTIFVTDPLVTVSRGFLWTITAPAADTTAPALSITSHSNGQTVSSPSVTIAGTATDSGRGGNGVTSVTVNGQPATGGTVSGNATASWNRTVTLATGANVVAVQAVDSQGNQANQQITLNYSIAPVTSAVMTANLTSPQNTGTAITFTANGTGGVAPNQFKFFVQPSGASPQIVRDWSTTNTYAWTPAVAGNYTIIVWARSAGITTDVAQASAQVAYVINTPPISPVTSATLTPNLASPQNANTPVTFTASGTGGVAPRQFKFFVQQGTGAVQLAQDWSTATTYTWTPATAASYTVTVWARSAGVTTDAAQASAQVAYVINTPPISPVTTVTLTPNLASPQNANTPITFTASGTGGVAPRQFKFFVQQETGAAQVAQDWSTATTYTWTPATAASYTVTVWARSAGVTGDAAQASSQLAYVVNAPPSPVIAVSATPVSGSGLTQTFALQYSNSGSAGNLKQVWVWFTNAFGSNASSSCLLNYDRASRQLYLLNDAASDWMPGVLGIGTVLQNGQCSVALNRSSVSMSGTTLTLNVAMTFKSSFEGAKQVYLYAANASGSNSGWQDRGDWTVTASPTTGVQVVSATPSSGSGASATFSLQYADSGGASHLSTTWVWFTAAFTSSAANSCLIYYDRRLAVLYLLGSDGKNWTRGALGSGEALGNRHCSIDLARSSVTISGTSLTLNLAMSFYPRYAGTKTIYMFANNASSVESGWQTRGSWIVP
jgi:hypothetical protein